MARPTPPHRARPHRPRAGGRTATPSPAWPDPRDVTVLYGWHPVQEALLNPARRHRRLLVTENALRRLGEALPTLPIAPETVRTDDISRLLEPDSVHQGLYLECDPLDGPDLDRLPDGALLVVLDQVTDPHNVGAILRSAAAFGAAALVTTARHSPAATGVLAKAASGGLEHVPIVTVGNLADALISLGKRGIRRVGLDSDGATEFGTLPPAAGPTALVLGAEGKGLRHRTRECCDVVARLDMPGAIRSLNVSNAAAIALYALSRPARLGGSTER